MYVLLYKIFNDEAIGLISENWKPAKSGKEKTVTPMHNSPNLEFSDNIKKIKKIIKILLNCDKVISKYCLR